MLELCSVYSLSFVSLLFLYIFAGIHKRICVKLLYEKERPVPFEHVLSLPLIFILLLFLPSLESNTILQIMLYLKHSRLQLFSFASRRSSYFDPPRLYRVISKRWFRLAHAPCGTFYLNYKLLVKYELQI